MKLKRVFIPLFLLAGLATLPMAFAAAGDQTVTLSDVHICCAKCVTAVQDVLSKVDGVKENTVKAKATSFTVTGDFDAKALADAFQKAGLTGKLAAPK